MKRLTIVCMLIAMGSPTLYAQTNPDYQSRVPPVIQDIQPNVFGTQIEKYGEIADGNRRAYAAKLTALRAKLTEGWQLLGMSEEAAQHVAAAYEPKRAATAHRVSLEGKTNQEIAAMLQTALANKDYMLADRTLIEFQLKSARSSSDGEN